MFSFLQLNPNSIAGSVIEGFLLMLSKSKLQNQQEE